MDSTLLSVTPVEHSPDVSEKQKRRRKPKSVEEKVEKRLKKQNCICKWGNCNMMFANSLQLKDHLEDHIGKGLKSYVCMWEGCDFGERRKRDHMKSHIRKHHKFVGFFCPTCGEGFVRDQELRKHVCGVPSADGAQYGSPSSPNGSSDGQTRHFHQVDSPGRFSSSDFHSEHELSSPHFATFETTKVHGKRQREPEEDDVLRWLNSVGSGVVESNFTPDLLLEMDGLMEKFEVEPDSLERYIPVIAQCHPFFKRVKQEFDEFSLPPAQELEELFGFEDQPTEVQQPQNAFPTQIQYQPVQYQQVSYQPQFQPQRYPQQPQQPQQVRQFQQDQYVPLPASQSAYQAAPPNDNLGNESGFYYEDFRSGQITYDPLAFKRNDGEGSDSEDDDDFEEDYEDEGSSAFDSEESADEDDIVKGMNGLALKPRKPKKIRTAADFTRFLETLILFGEGQ